MNPEELQSLQDWFSAYCDSFSTPLVEDQRNFTVKRVHTHEVCLNAARIAQELGLDPHAAMLAHIASLFHDVGRFPQYAQYKTFDDTRSVNHAGLGVTVLQEKNVLRNLSKHDQELVIRSVALHNVFSLPENLDQETLLLAKLVRDADKLDILRVFIEYFEQEEESRAGAVTLGLPDTPGYSPAILSCLKKGVMAEKSQLRTQNDFKLLQLSWLFDLNFASSFRMLVERDFISTLLKKLPNTDEIAETATVIHAYVQEKLQRG